MNFKIWVLEVQLAACLVAAAMVAFSLMAGFACWQSLAPKRLQASNARQRGGRSSYLPR